MSVVKESVEKGGTHNRFGKLLMPVFYGSIARNDDRSFFISFANNFVENRKELVWKCLKAPVIQYEKIRFEKLLQLPRVGVIGLPCEDILQHFHRSSESY